MREHGLIVMGVHIDKARRDNESVASMMLASALGTDAPMATMRSPSMRTSALKRGAPVPSMTLPPATTSAGPGDC